jgi:alkylation response protein AidB-like acyl-CoA dehydrogenase
MALILNDDERALQESVRRFVTDRSPLTKLRELMDSGAAYDGDLWKQMSAQLGLAGLIIPEAHDGAEAGYSALSVALTELGAGLVASPLLAGALAAGTLLRLGDESARADLLPGLASGELIVSLAALAADGAVTASGDALTGELAPVLNGAQAGVLLVPAVRDGQPVIFAVNSDAAGLSVTALPSTDPSRALAAVRLEHTPGRALAGDAAGALAFAASLADLALASEQVGAMAACLEMTTEYARIRIAFGRPIGAFQGVKHKLADIATARELAHALVRDAARAADERPADFAAAAAAARVMTSAPYFEAASATIRLHGGIGFTWEHDAHLYYKNAMAGEVLFGTPDEQLDRLAAALAGG